MSNPAGNYPGRQIFVGALESGEPAFAYFVSGRSAGSQGRYISPFLPQENAVRIKPINPNEKFDQFRHYQAVKIDLETGTLVVSNSQAPVDATLEAFVYKGKESAEAIEYKEFLQRLLVAIGPEYDSKEKPTSRIVGGIIPSKPRIGILAITDRNSHAIAKHFPLKPGHLASVSTYDGNIDYRNFNSYELCDPKYVVKASATNPKDLADEIYGMSDYIDPKHGELRVAVVAGIDNGNGPGGWNIAIRNRHKFPA